MRNILEKIVLAGTILATAASNGYADDSFKNSTKNPDSFNSRTGSIEQIKGDSYFNETLDVNDRDVTYPVKVITMSDPVKPGIKVGDDSEYSYIDIRKAFGKRMTNNAQLDLFRGLYRGLEAGHSEVLDSIYDVLTNDKELSDTEKQAFEKYGKPALENYTKHTMFNPQLQENGKFSDTDVRLALLIYENKDLQKSLSSMNDVYQGYKSEHPNIK